MKWNKVISAIYLLLTSSLVFAYDEPIVNLGYTSFLDGGPPAGPGFYFQNYFQYYGANRLNDKNGHPIPLPRTKLDAFVTIPQIIYLSDYRLLGARLGVSALLPWVLNAKVDDGLNNSVLKAHDGPSDIFIGPALQFDPIMRENGKEPLYVQRFELDMVVPVGRYDSDFAINPSSNFWSINPYWAATLWITPKWTFAWRLHYLWNAKNTDPNISFGPFVNNTQAGQAVFANFATEYGVTEVFHVGINGYAFDQFTDTKVNGVSMPGRREQIWAIGPGVLFGLTKNQFLFFNLYVEHDAKNRPQGTNGILRYVLHFS